jgi:hypothetical protein
MNWQLGLTVACSSSGIVLMLIAMANGMSAEEPKTRRNVVFAIIACVLYGIASAAGAG